MPRREQLHRHLDRLFLTKGFGLHTFESSPTEPFVAFSVLAICAAMRSSRKVGFTLVELLVVIAIIGLLIALLLPAVQAAREAARRSQCSTNLSQLGKACFNYEDANRTLPMGTVDQISSDIGSNDRRNWLFFTLPFMEQETIYENWYAWYNAGGTAPWWYEPDRMVVLPVYFCPSDPISPKTLTHEDLGPGSDQGFHSNYVGCSGSTVFNPGGSLGDTLNGIFYYKHATPIRNIQDGTSHTLLTGEIILAVDNTDPDPQSYGHDVRGRMWNPANQGAILFSTQWSPNTAVSDVLNYCQNSNPRAPCIASTTNIVLYARSYHTGGVNAGLADGSVQFIEDNVDFNIFRALGTRAGGEIVTDY